MLTRRAALLGLVAAAPPPSAGTALPAVATLLVPGPLDGPYARWAGRLALAFGRPGGHAASPRLTPSVLGAPDGVTAANRFAVEAGPDGRTLLLLTSAALQARLVGEPRARFDSTGWLPVCAARRPPLAVVGRAAMPVPGAPLRLGLGPAEAAETVALLALDRMGHHATPVMGLSPDAARAALAQGAVDAIPLSLDDGAATLVDVAVRPWFVLEDANARDPALPDVPTAFELAPAGPAALAAALRAAAANTRLAAAVMLPPLTPGDLLAGWRAVARRWVEEEGRGYVARPVPAQAAGPLLVAQGASAETTAAYRGWLLSRLNWRAD